MSPRPRHLPKSADAQPVGTGRRLDVQLAIVVALFGLLGTAVGGISTYMITRHSEGVAQKSDLRDERRDAYAKFYGDAAAYSVSVKEYLEATSPASQAAALKEFDGRARQLFQDQAVVVLLGAPEVTRAGFILGAQVARLEQAVQETPIDKAKILDEVSKTGDALDGFSEVAVRDLKK